MSAGVHPHAMITIRAGVPRAGLPWWIRLSSYRLWLVGLALFASADAAAAVVGLVAPSLLR